MIFDEVMPLLPSAAGQSARFITSTGRTSHQICPVLTRLLSTTWLWFGVGTKTWALAGEGALPNATNVCDKSTLEACMVQVPAAPFGSGHWVAMAGLTLAFQASGSAPNSE